MRSNAYICSHFVKPALEWIVTGNVSSMSDRVAILLKQAYGCGIKEEDFPEEVRKDWRAIEAVWAKPIAADYKGVSDKREAAAHSLTRKEAKHVLECFLRVAYVVISSG
jgi:hypothetical protein